jgi:hypothetical protein
VKVCQTTYIAIPAPQSTRQTNHGAKAFLDR